jgi:hypothetical protein
MTGLDFVGIACLAVVMVVGLVVLIVSLVQVFA